MKKILFKTMLADIFMEKPRQSSKTIPSWYKAMDRVTDGVQTVKTCMPFLDAYTAGYTLVLPADIYVKNGQIQEITNVQIVEKHKPSQTIDMPLSGEYYSQPYKWINYFFIKTPRGYSSFFMHPVNRLDLPFYTLSGFVDTDSFPAPVNFPFFIKKDFEGIIKEGTPIAQVIPIKREDWKMDVNDSENHHVPSSITNNLGNPPFNLYKRKFWKQKRYQ